MRKKKRTKKRTAPSSSFTSTRKLAVIGIGNPLMGDDAAGILALEKLLKTDLPRGTKIIDAGTGGMSLLHILSKYDAVVIADAVDMGLRVGQVRVFSPNEVVPGKTRERFSIHEGDFLEVVKVAQQLDECPEKIRICAIQPKLIKPSSGLTREVQEALPRLAQRVTSELWKFDQTRSKHDASKVHLSRKRFGYAFFQ